VFDEEASEVLVAQAKRKRRKLLDIAYTIAESPFAEPDRWSQDEDHRNIGHITTEGYVISYWVDAPVKRIVIVEIAKDE
jgi:mRNA-degrading endonuclease RelE of RelBE toxin-antitoxin system